MRVIQARNTEQALRAGLALLEQHGQPMASRNGPVVVAPWPVMTVTARPTERVIFAPWRDANPFFYLVETVWMLAGRDDTAFLTPYVMRFAQYGEGSTGRMHGAYGARWRSALGLDQLNSVVHRLQRDPGDRQCVLQMWDATMITANVGDYGTVTEYRGHEDLTGAWMDRPCNTHAYLRVRNMQDSDVRGHAQYMDLTVCCRSNDMLWGAHGSNAVHFSYLLEYLAGRLGVGVGTMYQLSNNYHLYVAQAEPLSERLAAHDDTHTTTRYEKVKVTPQPMLLPGEPPLDPDLLRLCRFLETAHTHVLDVDPGWFDTAFCRLVWQAALAHWQYRHQRHAEALLAAEKIEASDWRAACVEWLQRHVKVPA